MSDFLFASSSFVRGLGRVLDVGSSMSKSSYSTSRSGREADAKAMINDWKVVGNDIREGMGAVQGDVEEAVEEAQV